MEIASKGVECLLNYVGEFGVYVFWGYELTACKFRIPLSMCLLPADARDVLEGTILPCCQTPHTVSPI